MMYYENKPHVYFVYNYWDVVFVHLSKDLVSKSYSFHKDINVKFSFRMD